MKKIKNTIIFLTFLLITAGILSGCSGGNTNPRTIVQKALNQSKKIESYHLSASYENTFDNPDYAEQNRTYFMEADVIANPLKISAVINDMYGEETELVESYHYIVYEEGIYKVFYKEGENMWLGDEMEEDQIANYLMDQSGLVEIFIRNNAEFTLVSTETINGQEINTIEMVGGPSVVKSVMGADDFDELDQYLQELSVSMTVQCGPDGFTGFQSDQTSLYRGIGDAIQNDPEYNEEQYGMLVSVYNSVNNKFDIRISNINKVEEIPVPDGLITSDMSEEELIERGVGDGDGTITPDDIGIIPADEESAAVLESADIYLEYDDGTIEMIQEGKDPEEPESEQDQDDVDTGEDEGESGEPTE